MTYYRPETLDQALTLSARPAMRLLAGGTDVFPVTQSRDLPGDILDITAVQGLRGIEKTDFGWRIGATTCWADVIRAELPPAFDSLKQAAFSLGSKQIQNSATIAGNLCNASPAADGVPPLLVLSAQVEIASSNAVRRLPLSDFILGVRQTALVPGEIVTALHIPDQAGRGKSVFSKLGTREYLVISTIMIALRLEQSAGLISSAAIAVGACSPVACRLPALEAVLVGRNPCEPDAWQTVLKADVEAHLHPIDDIRADAKYRSNAVIELVNQMICKVGRV